MELEWANDKKILAKWVPEDWKTKIPRDARVRGLSENGLFLYYVMFVLDLRNEDKVVWLSLFEAKGLSGDDLAGGFEELLQTGFLPLSLLDNEDD